MCVLPVPPPTPGVTTCATLLDVGAAFQDFPWLTTNMLEGVVRPNGATLLLFGDSPLLNHPPTLCHINHNLCRAMPRTTEGVLVGCPGGCEGLRAYASSQGNDVKVFLQSPLWEVAPGQHFWGNVPGTDTNAYYDTGHLLALGARYLSPYMCSAFEGWGFFTPAQVSG